MAPTERRPKACAGNVCDTRLASYRDLPESRITNPYLAAFVTSFVRAAIGEILARLPLHVQVSNVTTDGLLSTATEAESLTASQGPICILFGQARYRICNSVQVLEAKHQVAQVLGWRTRGQATLQPLPGQEIVLAKAGLNAPVKDKADQNAWIIDLFSCRTPNTTQMLKVLRTLPEIYKNGGDLTVREVIRRVSMEFDWKRCPTLPSMRAIGEEPHLFFDTVPWNTADDFQACRDSWEGFVSRDGRVLKTEEDLQQFNDYRASFDTPGLRKPRHDTSLRLAKRMFLRAYVRSAWGLDARVATYSEIAHWLSTLGYSAADSDLENANRSTAKLVAQVVPRTPVVETFVAKILEQFPGFQADQLLAPVVSPRSTPPAASM
jgi:hypothetical protein